MPIESDADRAVFTAASDFGVVARYLPLSGGAANNIQGIFDTNYMQIDGNGEVSVSGNLPRFVCASLLLADSGREGDQLLINGKNYVVREVRPDGTGMTELYCHEGT
jgi:hypothetical protein